MYYILHNYYKSKYIHVALVEATSHEYRVPGTASNYRKNTVCLSSVFQKSILSALRMYVRGMISSIVYCCSAINR